MTHAPHPASGRPAKPAIVRLLQYLLLQLLALGVFVGFPALVTAIAPVSWVTCARHDGQVTATAKTCLLFVVPYRTQTVSAVASFGEREVAGGISRERRTGQPDRLTQAEDEGFLVIRGPDATVAEVPVTPYNLDNVVQRCNAFLQDREAEELNLFVVANWKFSIIAGGLISLLTVIYVLTIAFGLCVKLVHVFQWALHVPPEQRWLAGHLKANDP